MYCPAHRPLQPQGQVHLAIAAAGGIAPARAAGGLVVEHLVERRGVQDVQ